MREMRLFAMISSWFAVVAVTAVLAHAQTPAPAAPPGFEPLFVGSFEVADFSTMDGTFGTRVRVSTAGGDFFNATTGELVATALPFVDYGIIGTSGTFFPDLVLSLRWTVDNKLAYLHANGVGSFTTSDLVYIHAETDSETYSGLNSRFLIGNISFSPDVGSAPVVTIFGAV